MDFQVTELVQSGAGAAFVVGPSTRKGERDARFERAIAYFVGRSVTVWGPGTEAEGYILNVPGVLVRARRIRDGEGTRWDAFCETAPWVDVADVEAGFCAAVLGGRLRFSPGELVDFVTGWFGADIGWDDEPRCTGSMESWRRRRMRPMPSAGPAASGERASLDPCGRTPQ